MNVTSAVASAGVLTTADGIPALAHPGFDYIPIPLRRGRIVAAFIRQEPPEPGQLRHEPMETTDLPWDGCLKGISLPGSFRLRLPPPILFYGCTTTWSVLVINQSTAAVSSTSKNKDVFRPTCFTERVKNSINKKAKDRAGCAKNAEHLAPNHGRWLLRHQRRLIG